MPDPALLTPTGRRLLDDLPPILRDDPDYQGVIHAGAREIERLEAKIAEMGLQFFPQHADVLLKAWEAQFRLPIEPPGASVEERRTVVLARVGALGGSAAGADWVEDVDDLIGPGWSYREHMVDSEKLILNAITKPSFEVDTAGWTHNANTQARENAWAAHGTWAWRMTRITVGTGELSAFSPPITGLRKGDTLACRATLNILTVATGNPPRIIVQWDDGSGTWALGTSVAATGVWATGVQELLGISGPAPAGTSQARLRIIGSTVGAETIDWRLDAVLARKNIDFVPDYIDGSFGGTDAEWAGAANGSATRQPSPPAYTLWIFLPFGPESGQYAYVESLLQDITPAHLDLVLTDGQGFMLDRSQLDQETLA